MPTEEELTAQIAALGEKIKEAKADKKPKEEWDPFLQEMLALKVWLQAFAQAMFWVVARTESKKFSACCCSYEDSI